MMIKHTGFFDKDKDLHIVGQQTIGKDNFKVRKIPRSLWGNL
jgi:hypothetical protein